ncbi:tRNA (adenosine(37)-N6)-threonylcarbamoyltransferase complex dimerization subunit type 1 TsaB [Tomitella fengzijianii]|uniref:tRNA (Adenosine(37)-N6)-threonylcarbamoyltransferase complex dimerization subunit type 1 TsaB n=1 Tax=Tomitella fengzijianii TaxID=2597660 RepID=A0A516X0Y7_9ACTN|nr:tRNA (adenosine(37)-N6)-threonylcarbamoyltransferase complex dimerization subunit type 1 TsaB [Tomitella fengzijianii]QDQ96677.1 tRNA (adenosine(37)-N6)-threonylcarbamoyltransferase complex dimerization subunit type 1 TsaB [Tomitella fengzijianii]
MLVLTVDTSTPAVTAGLVRLAGAVAEPVAVRVTRDARAHAEVLTPQILECLQEAGAAPTDLDAVVVGAGPGPFTGLRVGMATAAAFGDALGIPVHGVCSLDAIAAQVVADARASEGVLQEFLVVTDARRREVYWARYRGGARVEGPEVVKPADLAVGAADAAAGSSEHVGLLGLTALPPRSPTPAGIAALAAAEIAAHTEPAPLEPLYLRRPDAAEPRPRVRAAKAPA